MKVTYSFEKINPFGGLNFVHKTLDNKGVFKLIDETLVNRAVQTCYSYSDIIKLCRQGRE